MMINHDSSVSRSKQNSPIQKQSIKVVSHDSFYRHLLASRSSYEHLLVSNLLIPAPCSWSSSFGIFVCKQYHTVARAVTYMWDILIKKWISNYMITYKLKVKETHHWNDPRLSSSSHSVPSVVWGTRSLLRSILSFIQPLIFWCASCFVGDIYSELIDWLFAKEKQVKTINYLYISPENNWAHHKIGGWVKMKIVLFFFALQPLLYRQIK